MDKVDDSDLIKAAQAVVGDKLVVGISPTTDGAQFTQSKKDFDFLIYGPGVSTLPHQVDEYIEVDDYLNFIDVYQDIMVEYLK